MFFVFVPLLTLLKGALPVQDLTSLWEACLLTLRRSFSESYVATWFADLRLLYADDRYAVLANRSDLKIQFLKNNKSESILADCLSDHLGFRPSVHLFSEEKGEIDIPRLIVSLQESGREPEEEKPSASPSAEKDSDFVGNSNFFNANYTFENFIVGTSNNFAHAASIAVSNTPAQEYNPLFIYGPSGLGKTHLLYAITNRIREKHPHMRIVYVKCEDFVNQMIEKIRLGLPMTDFRKKYRKADVLLIDDVQFIANKGGTQEEFFNTFNTLYEDNKQIIFTSDRPPKDINPLEERIRSRFEWGLIADIIPPELELRVAIIRDKAQKMGMDLTDEVIYILAENLTNNIRQLEGALKKLSAQHFLNRSAITSDMAVNCVAGMIDGREPVNVTVDKILDRVSRKYGIPVKAITGQERKQDYMYARHIAIYITRKMTEMSFPAIAKVFNKKDHTTIRSSFLHIDQSIVKDTKLEIEIKELMKDIREH